MATPNDLNLYLLTFNCGRELVNPEVFASHMFDALPTNISNTQNGEAPTSNTILSTSSSNPGSNELPDIIVFYLQEVAPIAYAFLGGSFVTPYLDRFRSAVDLAAKKQSLTSGSDDGDAHYVNIRAETAGLTGIMVFIRSDLMSHVQDLMTASVGVGVQQTGNKGAIGVRINWKLNESSSISSDETSGQETMNMTFVSAHLAPFEGELERRNQDYKDIVKGLVFNSDLKVNSSSSKQAEDIADAGEEDVPLLQGTTQTPSSYANPVGMYTPTAHLFFAGDLNYRTSITAPSKSGSDQSSWPKPPQQQSTTNTSSTDSLKQHFSALFQKDQLTQALKSHKTLHGLVEAPITFGPTYKYNFPDSSTADVLTESDFHSMAHYPFASHRWPSWCDRILYSASSPSGSEGTSIRVQTYTSLPLFRTSDHRPVAMSVLVPLKPVNNPEFAAQQPVELNPDWKVDRDAARRREIVVGLASYVVLTWEGRMILLASLVGLVGTVLVARGLGV